MDLCIGTSGWQYRDWRDPVYGGAPQRLWLERYAERFDTVEVNSSFYRLPTKEVFRQWAARTPASFTFAVKVSRYLSHVRRLRDPAEPVQRFLERAAALGEKLGVALLQLPPDLPKELGRLEELLGLWPCAVPLAIEFRHASWFDDDVHQLLQGHDVACCVADRDEQPTGPLWRTADWCYLRLHAGTGTPPPSYTDDTLRAWDQRLRSTWGPTPGGFVFFNNDPGACAVHDADRFQGLQLSSGVA